MFTMRKSVAGILVAVSAAGVTLSACGSSNSGAEPTTSLSASPAAADSGNSSAVVLPVDKNPIVNAATDKSLQVTYAAVEDNVDPTTGKAIDDCLELTLANSGSAPLTGLEVYYEMVDAVTGASEGYFQSLDGVSVPAGQEVTVYFDNQTGPGHFPDNKFSLYRTSDNQVDFAIQVSANEAAIATATAVKAENTGEQAD